MPKNSYFSLCFNNRYKNYKYYFAFQLSIFILITILITLFSGKAHAAQVRVTIAPSIDERCVGHKIYYGHSTDFSQQSDMGSSTTYLTPSLQRGVIYYFAASAYDIYGNESKLSDIVPYRVPEVDEEPDDNDNANISFELKEDFENYSVGDNPSGWFDTQAENSMEEDNSLFKVFTINNQKVFGTTSTLRNIHSHHITSYIENLSSFEYSGRMMMTDARGGIGVTFLSHYPFSDTYYRLRCTRNSSSFHLAPHPHDTAAVFGTTDTGVIAQANAWYRFRIKVQDTGYQTEILAKVWHENDPEPEHWQIDAYDDTSQRLVSGTFGVWSGHAGAKYWDDLTVTEPGKCVDDKDNSGSIEIIEDFENYSAGDNPSNWFDTQAENSMVEDNSLFKVFTINNQKVFGTTSTLRNIHSHHITSYIENLSSFEYSGRMMMTDPDGGVGVTFLSHYPFSDVYYRLRCTRNHSSFHLAPHPHATAVVFGTTDTGIVPQPNEWYRFRIRVQDTGLQTEILAKVWPEHAPEPHQWQIDAFDDSQQRLVSGTFGVWSGHAGFKYWDDLRLFK